MHFSAGRLPKTATCVWPRPSWDPSTARIGGLPKSLISGFQFNATASPRRCVCVCVCVCVCRVLQACCNETECSGTTAVPHHSFFSRTGSTSSPGCSHGSWHFLPTSATAAELYLLCKKASIQIQVNGDLGSEVRLWGSQQSALSPHCSCRGFCP